MAPITEEDFVRYLLADGIHVPGKTKPAEEDAASDDSWGSGQPRAEPGRFWKFRKWHPTWSDFSLQGRFLKMFLDVFGANILF